MQRLGTWPIWMQCLLRDSAENAAILHAQPQKQATGVADLATVQMITLA